MKGVDAPIIPVNLDGVWGSIFSFERGRFMWKLPRSIPYPVTVSFGKPMPPTSTPFEVRAAVQELQTEAYRHRKKPHAHAAPVADSHSAPASLPFRHGRQAAPANEMGRGAAERDFSGAAAAKHLGGAGDGRHSAAAVRAGRAREFRGHACGQNSGESELHALGRSAGVRAPRNASSKP